MGDVVKLVGLDFGTTTTSAVFAQGTLARNPLTGRTELRDVREIYRSDVIFTPFDGELCDSDAALADLLAATPAIHGFETAGPRAADEVSRRVRLHQAIAREAIQSELRIDELAAITPSRTIHTTASSKAEHLDSPDLGARLFDESLEGLSIEEAEVQMLISDGLSAEAVHHNLASLLPIVLDGVESRGVAVGTPLLARYGRVKLAEPVAERLGATVVIHLLGERPGGDALASRSLSAYLVLRLGDGPTQQEAAAFSGSSSVRFEYTVISNIYSGGLPPLEAGAVIVERVLQNPGVLEESGERVADLERGRRNGDPRARGALRAEAKRGEDTSSSARR